MKSNDKDYGNCDNKSKYLLKDYYLHLKAGWKLKSLSLCLTIFSIIKRRVVLIN